MNANGTTDLDNRELPTLGERFDCFDREADEFRDFAA